MSARNPVLRTALLLSAAWLAVSVAPIAARSQSRAPRSSGTSTPTFRQVGGTGTQALVSGDRVLITGANSSLGAGGIVIDETSQSRTKVTVPTGCYNKAFGGHHLLYACPPSPSDPAVQPYVLDNLLSGMRRQIALPAGSSPTAIGNTWARLTRPVDTDEHSPQRISYLNLASGAVRADPVRSGGRVIADLNAASLTRRACAPVRVPRSYDPISQTVIAGQLIPLDKAVLSIGADLSSSPTDFGSSLVRLVRCGSGASRTIDAQPDELAFSPHLVLWQNDTNQLTGYVLPSERTIHITLPRAIASYGIPIAISTKNVYVNVNETVWVTPLAPLLS